MSTKTAIRDRRIALRVRDHDKELLMRAAAVERMDVTAFILHAALPAAKKTLRKAETVRLSARDSGRVLKLLENPPKPTRALQAAAKRNREIFGR